MVKKLLKLMNARARKGEAYVPTNVEHCANLMTHGWLVLPSVMGAYYLCTKSSTLFEGGIALLYGCAILALFSVSSGFHLISLLGKNRTLKNFLHIGDRAVIYIFIAASYTPWLVLKEFHDSWGLFTLYVVWFGAIFGIIYQYAFHERFKSLELFFYLLIGVGPALVVLQMHETSGIYEVSLGGFIYCLGVIFFKLDGVIPFAHAIWHCFVFVGAWTHYSAVDRYLFSSNTSPVDAAIVTD